MKMCVVIKGSTVFAINICLSNWVIREQNYKILLCKNVTLHADKRVYPLFVSTDFISKDTIF